MESLDADLTLAQAAELAGRSTKTLRRAVHEGALPRRYVQTPYGAQLVFRREDLVAWTDKRERPRTMAARAEHPTEGALSREAEQRLGELAWSVGVLGDRLAELERSLALLRGDARRLSHPAPSDGATALSADELFPLQERRRPGPRQHEPVRRRAADSWRRLWHLWPGR